MRTIPLADIRAGGPHQLVRDYSGQARELIAASRRTLGLFSDLACRVALPLADRTSLRWLEENGNPYLGEIRRCADHLGVTGVYALNVCFEWGCTSGVYAREDGPTLARTLDWIFPKLGEHLIVAHQRGRAGDFYNVTWPGVSGVFQGMAPARFAAAINQAPMRRHRLTLLGDWIKNRRQVFSMKALPPAHLLREVFENALDYGEAKERLSRTPVALPAIYILAGPRAGKGCVIERTEHDHAVRPLEGDRVCASNQFDTHLNLAGHGWRPRPIDSAGRVRLACATPPAALDREFGWFEPPIANAHTRLAMTACAATGELSVFGTRGRERVTETLSIVAG